LRTVSDDSSMSVVCTSIISCGDDGAKVGSGGWGVGGAVASRLHGIQEVWTHLRARDVEAWGDVLPDAPPPRLPIAVDDAVARYGRDGDVGGVPAVHERLRQCAEGCSHRMTQATGVWG